MAQLTPNSSYSLTISLIYPNRPGMLAKITGAIAECGGSMGDITLIDQSLEFSRRQLVVDAASSEQAEEILNSLKGIPDVEVEEAVDRTVALHLGGKIHLVSRIAVKNQSDLAMAYTPGVGRICQAIAERPQEVYNLTIKGNTIAVVTDGSAVLGLGNLGPEAALPVMEGKALLFKEFAGLDAFPICLATQDADEIVETVKRLVPVFGGINLEDISAPRCFEVERRLREETDIPIFHDDQHGTAIVTYAALINALKLVGKSLDRVRIIINGAGAAGIAIAKLLCEAGAKKEKIWLCDSKGIISTNREGLSPQKQEFAVSASGTLADAFQGADIFIGVSVPGVVTPEMVRSMSEQPIVMAMANPIPEIQPELVRDTVAVMATGRSDYPNQINNVLAFPGIFRGALDCRATHITTHMCIKAGEAIAALISSEELSDRVIIPSVFDPRVAPAVAEAVAKAAREEGVVRE